MKKVCKTLAVALVLFAVALCLVADASAQGARTVKAGVGVKPIDPVGVVNAAWKVKVTVDKADATYKIGEEIRITVTSEQPGYLFLFNVVAGQDPVCIMPNQFQQDNTIEANKSVVVPPPGNRNFRFTAREPGGREGLLAVVFKNRPTQLNPADLTRRTVTKVERFRLKRLIEVDGMGSAPAEVANQGNEGTFQITQEEKNRIQQQNPEQYQQKMKEWASDTIDVILVSKSGGKPEQEAPEQGTKSPRGKPQPSR